MNMNLNSNTFSTLYIENSPKILATLIRLVGTANTALAEDLTQDTFQRAMTHWQASGLPSKPEAWLMLTAKRAAIDYLRQSNTRQRITEYSLAPNLQSEWSRVYAVEQVFSEEAIEDDQLRLLFWVSSTDLPDNIRLPLVLKSLGGMSVEAIARALLVNPETIKKRLSRSKTLLSTAAYEIPANNALHAAISKVHQCLYLMFNEGLSAHHPNHQNRRDICLSAMRFLQLTLTSSTYFGASYHCDLPKEDVAKRKTPSLFNADTYALLALMHLHLARLPARFDENGLAIELNLQDRHLWDIREVKHGAFCLGRALNMNRDKASEYLLEALISFEHSRASSFEKTDWSVIEQHYALLSEINPSPLVRLNHVISVGHTKKYTQAFTLLEAIDNKKNTHITQRILATKAYLYMLTGKVILANKFAALAKKEGLADRDYECLIRQINAAQPP